MRPESIATQLLAFKRKTKLTPREFIAACAAGEQRDTPRVRRRLEEALALSRVRYRTVDTATKETAR